jgi:hypothetical protein
MKQLAIVAERLRFAKGRGPRQALLKRLFRPAKKEFQAPQKGFVSSKKTRAFFRISGLYSSTDCADASTRPRVAGGFRHSTPDRLPVCGLFGTAYNCCFDIIPLVRDEGLQVAL